MALERFEDIEAWQGTRQLVSEVYQALTSCRDLSFRDQIQRAAVSVMSNIAEGFERHTNREFIGYLYVSRGSLAEVRSLLYAAKDIGYVDGDRFDDLCTRVQSVNGKLNGFISYLNRYERETKAKCHPGKARKTDGTHDG